MIELTIKEQEALLVLYKDCTSHHNANSLAKEINITQVGTMKLLKRLESNDILLHKRIGKSIIYKPNIGNELTKRLIGFSLVNEATKHERWIDEFKPLNKKGRIILFYGSASRSYTQAKDIDIMIIDEKDKKDIHQIIREKQTILPKKIHSIELTPKELIKNLQEQNKTMVEIIKTATILYGYDKYMEILNGFTSI